VHKT